MMVAFVIMTTIAAAVCFSLSVSVLVSALLDKSSEK